MQRRGDIWISRTTSGPSGSIWRSAWIWIVCFVSASLLCPPLFAQLRDPFESGVARWQLSSSDTEARLVVHELRPGLAHEGQTSEWVELVQKTGTYTWLEYRLRPTAIIEEVKCSVWIRAAARGLKLGLRVVFPDAIHPTTSNPLTTILWGSPSSLGGQWTMVEVSNPLRLLLEQQRILRSQYGPQIDLRGAYIDAMVLDVYSGPGVARIQIDDLAADALVEVDQAPSAPSDPSLQIGLEGSPESIAIERTERIQDLRGKLARWVQYQGENLSWLASLGVTGVVLDQAPDEAWLDQAAEANLRVVAPPPEVTPPPERWSSYRPVIGWSLGTGLDRNHVDSVRTMSDRAALFPSQLQRPTLAEVMEDDWNYARLSDVLSIPAPLPTTLRDGGQQVELLRSAYERTRGYAIPLTTIQLQPTLEFTEQTEAMERILGSGTSRQLHGFDILQARMQLYRTIAAGARGWLFRSWSPLDAGEPESDARVAFLRATQVELQWIQPWVQGATTPAPLTTLRPQGYNGSIHALSDSQMILLWTEGVHDGHCTMPPTADVLRLPLPGWTDASQAFRISQGRLEPIAELVGPKDAVATIERPGFIECIIVTRNARATEYLQQRATSTARAMLEIESLQAEQLMRVAQWCLISEPVPPDDPAWRTLADCQALVRRSEFLESRAEWSGAVSQLQLASAGACRVLRASWQRAMVGYQQPQANPWLERAGYLPLFWQSRQSLANRPLQNLPIPQWPASSLAAMMEADWRMDRRLESIANSGVDILAADRPNEPSRIAVAASSRQGQSLAGGYAGSVLRLATPPIPVPPGSLVRIELQVETLQCSNHPQAGLLVYDSIAGPSSGQLLQLASNSNQGPETVVLERLQTSREPLRIFFEQRGEGMHRISALRCAYLMLDGDPQLRGSLIATPSIEPDSP